VAVPLVGRNKVDSMFRVVVLPAPLGPRKPKISPFFTVKLMPSTALTFPSKTLVSSWTSMVLIFLQASILVTGIQKIKIWFISEKHIMEN